MGESNQAKWWRQVLTASALMWWLNLGLLIVGVIAPLFTIHQFWVFDNTVSLLSGLIQLLQQGEWLLFLLIGAFSILFPLFKLVVLFPPSHQQSIPAERDKYFDWMNRFGKWSMLDVFVVAILVVAIKLGHVVKVEVHYGVYLFASAVILSMVIARQQGSKK